MPITQNETSRGCDAILLLAIGWVVIVIVKDGEVLRCNTVLLLGVKEWLKLLFIV